MLLERHSQRLYGGWKEEVYPKLCHEKCYVLVERVQDHFANSLIAPGTVNEEQLAQIAELSNRNISTSGGLKALNTANTDANMCSLYHRNIVCSIADSEKNGL